MNKERNAGYYWVKLFKKDPWIISYYTGIVWEIDNGNVANDNYWLEIDENKLVRNERI